VYHKTNGHKWMCPVHALAHCYIHLCTQDADSKTFLSVYYEDCGKRSNITNEDISRVLKAVATVLEYSMAKNIPINQINTHSLQSRGANALSLAGYLDTQIQKMGRWRGATFKVYIREELACFLEGMSTSMKRRFNFVNIAGNSFNTITDINQCVRCISCVKRNTARDRLGKVLGQMTQLRDCDMPLLHPSSAGGHSQTRIRP
jgi:hypothetical protein